jgi:hypothetical protein
MVSVEGTAKLEKKFGREFCGPNLLLMAPVDSVHIVTSKLSISVDISAGRVLDCIAPLSLINGIIPETP